MKLIILLVLFMTPVLLKIKIKPHFHNNVKKYDDYYYIPPPPICIVVICHNRPTLLKKTLQSIIDANGFSDNGINNLFISQSGDNKEVSEVIKEYSHNVIQNIDKVSKVKNRLAKHFGWTFNKLFKETNCDGLIVIEDDLELSPDFLDYFRITIPIVEKDNTLITASLWNDIGFKHNSKDKTAVKRTDFFPGLGWYLSRQVWEDILGPEWRDHDWDWYVRDKAMQLGMDSLIPEVPRDYHVASSGTYMTRAFFDKYFKNINVNRDYEFKWKNEYVDGKVSPLGAYKNYILQDIKESVVFWVDGFSRIRDKGRVRSKCRMFLRETGIWEGESERGRWYGIHKMWSQHFKSYLYIIDISEKRSEFTHYLIGDSVVFKDLEICEKFQIDHV